MAGLVVSGHAGYAPRGRDIVCAAVSALAQTAVRALEVLAGVQPGAKITEGYLECILPPALLSEKAELILEVAAVGLKEVGRAHPEYVSITEREVAGGDNGVRSSAFRPQERGR